MNKLMKMLTLTMVIASMVAGMATMSFAAVNDDDADTTDDTQTASAISEDLDNDDDADTADNGIDSPNTGVTGMAPMAVLMLAAACVPVIVKTRK